MKLPSQYWAEAEPKYKQREPDEYDFRERAQPKERARNYRTPQKTRNWEADVYQAASEQAPPITPTGRIGLEVLFLINSKSPPRHDLDNAIKTLKDALNRCAYVDDRQVDYLKALRVWGPDEPNRTLAKVYEIPERTTT